MKKILLVSSYSDSCGNAYFTKVLEQGLQDAGVDAACAELDLLLTQSILGNIRKKAELHITDLCSRLRAADGVNIQLEAGLYGTFPRDIISRFKRLVKANPNTSVTLHSPRLLGDAAFQRAAIKKLLRGNIFGAIGQWLRYKEAAIHIDINRSMIRFCVKNNVPLIVHTERAKQQIREFYEYENVHVHPLKIVGADHVMDGQPLESLRLRYRLEPDDVVIGMFGFINEYKGHSVALQAMRQLPSQYKLFIFGRVHPQTIKQGEKVSPYLSSLHGEIAAGKNLANRIYFVGEYPTEEFINLAGTVNAVWLPYAEVGQDGSGIASICCDVSPRVLASASFAFDELLRLIPYQNIERFDIGNSVELATKTRFPTLETPDMRVNNSIYSLQTQSALYARLLGVTTK